MNSRRMIRPEPGFNLHWGAGQDRGVLFHRWTPVAVILRHCWRPEHCPSGAGNKAYLVMRCPSGRETGPLTWENAQRIALWAGYEYAQSPEGRAPRKKRRRFGQSSLQLAA